VSDSISCKGAVCGLCGGWRNMTARDAALFGGRLLFRKSAAYRRDFFGFRKVGD
jgi:hypothetical protein